MVQLEIFLITSALSLVTSSRVCHLVLFQSRFSPQLGLELPDVVQCVEISRNTHWHHYRSFKYEVRVSLLLLFRTRPLSPMVPRLEVLMRNIGRCTSLSDLTAEALLLCISQKLEGMRN